MPPFREDREPQLKSISSYHGRDTTNEVMVRAKAVKNCVHKCRTGKRGGRGRGEGGGGGVGGGGNGSGSGGR